MNWNGGSQMKTDRTTWCRNSGTNKQGLGDEQVQENTTDTEEKFEPTSEVIISIKAEEKLHDLSKVYNTTPQEFVEALLHYAISVNKRPGSWEATMPFNFAHYDLRNDDAAADRWF